MFRIKYTPVFEKQLDKLDKKTIDKILKKVYLLKYGYINNNNVKQFQLI